MTEEQILRAQALERCRFLPASADKRFVRDMASRSRRLGPPPLTDRQAAHLVRLAWRYRRQMPANLVPAASPDQAAPIRGRQGYVVLDEFAFTEKA